MAERHALGFSLKTDEGCIRRFLRDFAEPDDGVLSFTKEYVLNHIGNRLNVQTNTVLRDVSAINGFLDFAIRKGYTAYKIPPKSLPKENRNFRAYIFTDDEIERMLIAADYVTIYGAEPCSKAPASCYVPDIIQLWIANLRTTESAHVRCGSQRKCVCYIRHEISQKPFGSILRFGFGGPDSISGKVPVRISRFINFSQFKPSRQWCKIRKQLAANSIPSASQNGRDSL